MRTKLPDLAIKNLDGTSWALPNVIGRIAVRAVPSD